MTGTQEHTALTASYAAIPENTHLAGKCSYELVNVKKHVALTRAFLIVNIPAEKDLIPCALRKSVIRY